MISFKKTRMKKSENRENFKDFWSDLRNFFLPVVMHMYSTIHISPSRRFMINFIITNRFFFGNTNQSVSETFKGVAFLFHIF